MTAQSKMCSSLPSRGVDCNVISWNKVILLHGKQPTNYMYVKEFICMHEYSVEHPLQQPLF